MNIWLPFFLSILEREETPIDEKKKALDALVDVMDDTGKLCGDPNLRPDLNLCDRMLSVCINWFATNENYRSSNEGIGKLLRYVLTCVYLFHRNSNLISRMIDNDFFFPFLFDGISKKDDEEHKKFVDILIDFARFSQKEHRDTIVIRYFHILKSAINTIFTRDVIYFRTIEGLCHNIELTLPMLALMPSVLSRWAMNTTLHGDRDKRGVCWVIFRVLEISLESPLTLERLLGAGTLAISRDFSLLPGRHNYREVADVFRSILEKYPGFRQQYREWTANGEIGNMVAELGRSIPPKDFKQGSDYVFYEEDKAI